MGHRPPEARPNGPNGAYRWTVQEPHDYDLDDAAATLARWLEVKPRDLGARTVNRILSMDAHTRDKPDPASDDDVAHYRAMLLHNGLFASLALPRRDLDHDEPTIRKTVDRYWTLEQTIAALAWLYSKRKPPRPRKPGRRTAHQGMTWVARKHRRPESFAPNKVSADDSTFWRQLLTRHDVRIFPAPPADNSSGGSDDTEDISTTANPVPPDPASG